jgi:hypothetical protein
MTRFVMRIERSETGTAGPETGMAGPTALGFLGFRVGLLGF